MREILTSLANFFGLKKKTAHPKSPAAQAIASTHGSSRIVDTTSKSIEMNTPPLRTTTVKVLSPPHQKSTLFLETKSLHPETTPTASVNKSVNKKDDKVTKERKFQNSVPQKLDLDPVEQLLLNGILKDPYLGVHDITTAFKNPSPVVTENLIGALEQIFREKQISKLISLYYRWSKDFDLLKKSPHLMKTVTHRQRTSIALVYALKSIPNVWNDYIEHCWPKRLPPEIVSTDQLPVNTAPERHPLDILAGLRIFNDTWHLRFFSYHLRLAIISAEDKEYAKAYQHLQNLQKEIEPEKEPLIEEILEHFKDATDFDFDSPEFQHDINKYMTRCKEIFRESHIKLKEDLERGIYFDDFQCADWLLKMDQKFLQDVMWSYQKQQKGDSLDLIKSLYGINIPYKSYDIPDVSILIPQMIERTKKAARMHWAPGYMLLAQCFAYLGKYFNSYLTLAKNKSSYLNNKSRFFCASSPIDYHTLQCHYYLLAVQNIKTAITLQPYSQPAYGTVSFDDSRCQPLDCLTYEDIEREYLEMMFDVYDIPNFKGIYDRSDTKGLHQKKIYSMQLGRMETERLIYGNNSKFSSTVSDSTTKCDQENAMEKNHAASMGR